MVAIGPNADYRAELLEDGGLGDTEAFQNVVREAERGQRDRLRQLRRGGLADLLAEGDQEAADNLEPLQGLGFSTLDRRTRASHAVFRLTTD